MKTDIHFKDSDERLVEGENTTALCGQEIHRMAFVYVQDIEALVHPMDFGTFRNGCRACLEIPMTKRRRYAIQHGELSLHPEDI